MHFPSYQPAVRSFSLFVIFVAAAYFSGDLLTHTSTQTLSKSSQVLHYGLQCAVWLSGAFFCNALFNLIFWDRMFAALFGDNQVPRLLKNVTGILIFAIAITGIIGVVFQKPITGIWATSGVVGIVLGLALQSMIRDIFVGLAVNIDKPYGIGDTITVHTTSLNKGTGARGLVLEINWRTTKLLTSDANILYIPNSVIGTSALTNHSAPSTSSESELDFMLAFTVEPARAKRILLGAALAIAREQGPVLLTPSPKVRIAGTEPGGVVYRIIFMTTQAHGTAKDLMLTSVLEHMHQAGLSLAYPQQDLYLADMPQRNVEGASAEDRTQLLQRVDIFAPLQVDELQFLADTGIQHLLKKGEVVFTYGDSSNEQDYSMFVLMEGLLHASIEQDDQTLRVGQIIPGEVFGEMSLLTGVARSATVIPATDVAIIEITQKAMAELLQRRPALMNNLSEIMAARKLHNEQASEISSDTLQADTRSSIATQLFDSMKNLFGRIGSQTN